jgi:hypothetical protein
MPTDWTVGSIIHGLNTGLQLGLDGMYQNAVFEKEELAILKAMARRQRKNDAAGIKVYEIEDTEADVMAKYETYLDWKEKLPMSEEEKQLLAVPLEQIIAEMSFEVSPVQGLLLAAGIIALPRFVPIGMAAWQKFQAQQEKAKEEIERLAAEQFEERQRRAAEPELVQATEIPPS